MENCVKILILEHDQNDIDLLLYELKKSGLSFVPKIVQTKEDFEAAISEFCPEIILSDYSLPSFDGLSAFQIRHTLSPETPFIIVSGTIGEENAVELIKKGVTDYALKERIYGIGPKIKRALREARERRQKLIAEQQLNQSREELQKILDQSPDVICTIDQVGKFVKVGAASRFVWGYLPEELVGNKYTDFVHKEDKEKSVEAEAAIVSGVELRNFENRYIRKDGEIVSMSWSVRWDEKEKLMNCVARDVTEKRVAEEKIRNNEKRFSALLQNSTDGLALLAADGTLLEISSSGKKILKIDSGEGIKKIPGDLILPEDFTIIAEAFANVLQDPDKVNTIECRFLLPDGKFIWIESSFHNQLEEPAVGAIVLNFRDITDRKLAEIALEASEKKYRNLFNLSPIPMWVYDVDSFCFLNVNEAAIKQYGYSKDEFFAMTLNDLILQHDVHDFKKVMNTLKGYSGYYHENTKHVRKNGEVINVDVKSNLVELNGKKTRIVLATDVSERMNYIKTIEEQNARMREIAWEQSHMVRAPLARIMGLITLLKDSSPEEVNFMEMLNHIMVSSTELDMLIRNIVKKTEQVSNER